MQLSSSVTSKSTYFVIFWLSAWILIFLTFLSILNPMHALRNSLGFVLPLTIPVFLLDLLFGRLFLNRKYLAYAISSVATLVFFGLVNLMIFKYVVKDPEAESNTVLSIILFFLIYRGVQYFRSGVGQQLKLNEALANQMKLELNLREAESRQFKAELDLLKAQINPHFLFNTLNNIYSLVVTRHENAADALLRLSSVMRYVLDAAKRDRVRLSDEISFIEDILSLEEIRLEDQCVTDFVVTEGFKDREVAPLLFIPMVENCFKHGISANKALNHVKISLTSNEQGITFTTVNHMASGPEKQLLRQSGNGIANLRKRLGIIYPGQATLEILQEDDDYKVKMKIL
jgi:LytS/YehU family sensor histidine kinase